MSKKNNKTQADTSQQVNTGVNTIKPKKISYSKDDLLSFGIVAIVVLIVAMIRSKFLSIPFERDEGAYSYYGKLLLEGGIPYKDFYEQKFPGIFYFYACIVGLFGDTVQGMHTGFMYINIITILLIYFAARNLFNPLAAVISAATFAFVSLTPNLSGFTVQSEHAAALFISLGIFFYSLADKSSKWYHLFLMGIAFGFSFMIKTNCVFLVLWGGIMTILNFFFGTDKKYTVLIKNTLIYSAGVLAVFALFLILILLKGSFNEMIYWAIEVPKKYVGKMTFEEGKKYFGYTLDAILLNHKFFWIHAVMACVLLLFKNITLKMKAFGITLAFFSFVTIVPGFYFYGHYWIMMIPGLAILSGLTFWGILTVLKDRFNLKMPALKYVYLGIFLALTLTHLSKQKSYYFHPNTDLILRQVYGTNPFPEAMEMANFINRTAKPEDKIVVIGSEPQIYFYTKKYSPSKHAYFAALVADVPEHKVWQREFVKDVEAAKPKYIIFFRHSISLFVQPNTDNYIFDWLNKYMSENYKIIGIGDMIDGQSTNYVWNENVNTYKPVSQSIIYVLERNPEPTPIKP